MYVWGPPLLGVLHRPFAPSKLVFDHLRPLEKPWIFSEEFSKQALGGIRIFYSQLSLFILRLSTSPAAGLQMREKHTLPNLPYAYNALEPTISAEIMQLHHQKHHQAYVNGLNTAEEKLQEGLQKGNNHFFDFSFLQNVLSAFRLRPDAHFGRTSNSFQWRWSYKS